MQCSEPVSPKTLGPHILRSGGKWFADQCEHGLVASWPRSSCLVEGVAYIRERSGICTPLAGTCPSAASADTASSGRLTAWDDLLGGLGDEEAGYSSEDESVPRSGGRQRTAAGPRRTGRPSSSAAPALVAQPGDVQSLIQLEM